MYVKNKMLQYIIYILGLSVLLFLFTRYKTRRMCTCITFGLELVKNFCYKKTITAVLSDNHKYITANISINGKDIESVILPTYSGLNGYIIKAWKVDDDNNMSLIHLLRYNGVYVNLELSPRILGTSSIQIEMMDKLTKEFVYYDCINDDIRIIDSINKFLAGQKDNIIRNASVHHKNSQPTDEADSQE